jgi:hypothetical protein
VHQQPPMHQLAILSTGCAAFFHSAPDGVHHSLFFFLFFVCCWSLYLVFFSVLDCFFLRPDLTHSYPTHLRLLISTALTNLGALVIIP